MMDFEKSFNIFIGTRNEDLDWFDNPYIQVKVYELTEAYEPKESENIKLRICDKEKDLKKFMTDKVADFYPNALCFEDLSQISIESNWWNEKFKNIYLTIEAC